ncbi:MAG: hypothetical protein Q9222_004396 [Ikaeria aurantiellina]
MVDKDGVDESDSNYDSAEDSSTAGSTDHDSEQDEATDCANQPIPCECGFVDYDSGCEDFNSDNSSSASDYDDYDQSQDGSAAHSTDGLLRSYRYHISCMARGPFPLEKLPPEIRYMIFRFAMPDDRGLPLHSPIYDWNDPNDTYGGDHDYLEFDRRSIDDEETKNPEPIPRGLFRANRLLSGEALQIFKKHFFFRMDVSSFGISARCGKTKDLWWFNGHKVLARWRPFKCIQNYHINIKSNARSSSFEPRYADLSNTPPNYQVCTENTREWLRLICDELLHNNIIRNLTITAPCACTLKKAGLVPKDPTHALDLFSPLKRLRLNNPVKISLHNDIHNQGIQDSCSQPQCLEMLQDLRAMIGRLQGEELNDREAKWKEIKNKVHRGRQIHKKAQKDGFYTWGCSSDFGTEQLWYCMNGHEDEHTNFEDAEEFTRDSLKELEAKVEDFWKRKAQEKEADSSQQHVDVQGRDSSSKAS